MNALACAYAGEVAIALIGEHQTVGPKALDSCGECWRTAVGCFLPVDVDVSVGKDGATHRTDAHGFLLHAHFFNNFCYKLVDNAV